MKVCNVIDHLRAGGGQRALLNVAKHLRARTQLSVRAFKGGPLLTQARDAAGDVWVSRGMLPARLLRLILKVRRDGPDIVHTHLDVSTLVGPMVRRAARSVWVAHIQNVPAGLVWFPRAQLFALRRAEAIVTCGEYVAREFRPLLGRAAQRLFVLPNSVPVSELSAVAADDVCTLVGADQGAPVVLFVGRLDEQKGVDVLLRAWEHIERLFSESFLAIVGEGPLHGSLSRMCVELGLERVRFLGFRSDVPALMKTAATLVLPSRWEGLPLVVLEAMAVGCPVVATRVGGCVEALGDGAGMLVRPENADQLAEALEQMLRDRRTREDIAANALKRVHAKYDSRVVAEETLRLYESVGG